MGSAGTNIVEAFLKDKKTAELLESDITRLSLLAIDIADSEIRSLQESHEKTQLALAKAGIPKERLRLIAQSVKFPTAEAMYDFINQKYNEYLLAEGAKLESFHPWLISTEAIPPMAGGAGRRRALAKAIYALNYYQLGIIKSFITAFKEQALSSIISPTIVIAYGLGGGTGSGIFFEFARHLRKMLGSGVPIIGLVVTPCGGDDPPAKGCSAFVAMNELSLLLNKEYNEIVIKKYGDYYKNPLNAMIYLPLLPAYSKVGNIISARREMDEMVVDMLYTVMDFDLADLLGGIGTEVGLTENYVHTLGTIRVNYPIDEYLSAFKLNFEKLELLHDLRKEKLDVVDKIAALIKVDNEAVRELYKNYLIRTGTFDVDQFEEKLKSIISSNPKTEEDLLLHVRGIEDQSKNWLSEIMKYLKTISQMKKGVVEDAVVKLSLRREGSRRIDNLESLLTNFSKTYLDFSERKAYIFERLKQLIPSSQIFTIRQKRILEDFMNLAELAEKAINALKFYDETRYITDALIRYYEGLPESESEMKQLKEIRSELATIYLMVQLMLRSPQDEIKIIDEHLTYLNDIKTKYLDRRNCEDNELIRIQENKKRKEFDKEKVDRQLRKFLSTKRYAREQMIQIERDLKRAQEEETLGLERLEKLDSVLCLYDDLSKKIEATSDYHKKLNKIVNLYKEYEEKIAEITQPKKYFERSTELTENEQLKIIFKILTEQEETLTKDIIYREILDKEHYKDFMKSIIRVFKTPSLMGYKPTYKSDYIWVTVTAPPKLWSEDLTQEIYTALAGYVTSEVSRTITVRVIEAQDPWTTRILVVGGRGKAEHLEAFDEMQLLYNKSSNFERGLSRSYLLEHGTSATKIVEEINGNQKKNSA